MKKTFKNFLTKAVAVVALAATAFTMTACGETHPAAENTEYVIGVSGPLSGGASVYGVAVKNSAQMAVDEINAAGGLNGVKFKLMTYDDVHDVKNVSTGYANHFEAGMQVSLGCVTSAPCLEYAKYAKEDNVFFLTPSASNDDVPAADNAYQMCFADGNQGSVAANYVNELGVEKIGLFYKSDDPYSNGIYEQFMDNLDDSVEVVEASFTGDGTDFTNQVAKVQECTFVFMPVYYEVARAFMTQAKGKVADDATYYGCDGFDGLDVTGIPQRVEMLSHFNSKAESGKAKEFVDKYTEKFGTDTLNQFGAAAYDCVYAIYGAMKQAYEADNSSVYVTMSASDLCNVLKGVFNGGYTYSGVTGENIKWESTGYVNKMAVAYVMKEADSASEE